MIDPKINYNKLRDDVAGK